LLVVYHLLADFVAMVHAAYVAFVVFGFLAIVYGITMGRLWIYNSYFRVLHLAAILLVCVEALTGVACPLTILEDRLRVLGGDTTYPGSFVRLVLDRLIFFDLPQWLFTVVYLAFGALVLLAFVVAPPRIGQSRR
jgi:hypothetical protein